MAKILLIEDEAGIRSLLRYDLRNLGHEVKEAEDGETALAMIENEDFDLLLVDWMLPKLSGIEIVEKLRLKGEQAIVIMLTAKDNEEDIIRAFECGADDYLTKPFSPRELTARINAHLKRFNKIDNTEKPIDIGNLEIDRQRRLIKIADEEIIVTKKEYELVDYFLSNLNIVLSRDTILNKIWGYSYDGDSRIVDVHIFNLRTKLAKADLTIKANRGVGYIMELKD